jgi:glyoxylase-like metal-dependent hydrolase (beta-lactamase superfamily II)
MTLSETYLLSRRGFCLCCVGAAASVGAAGWLRPHEAFAEARGIASLIKDSAAASPIVTYSLRNDISVLEGSGGTVAVTGPDGKLLIDAGIAVSRPQLTKALAELSADPITHLVNTHWHFDHTDGNAWLNAAGAKIIAQENTRKYLSRVERVADWDYNFLPQPPGGIPTEVFAREHSLRLNGSTIILKHYGPAHTDCDISVTFVEANVVHAADTFWNGTYPFIDYSTGGSIDGMIASDANLAAASDDTIVIAGHHKAVGTRAELHARPRNIFLHVRPLRRACRRTARPNRISPDNWVHDQALLDRPGNAEIQMDIFYDYRTNLPLYPAVQAYFRKHQPPALIVWGRNDKIFPADGAYPYKRDLPGVEFHLIDTGHFALEDKADEMVPLIRDFLNRKVSS